MRKTPLWVTFEGLAVGESDLKEVIRNGRSIWSNDEVQWLKMGGVQDA